MCLLAIHVSCLEKLKLLHTHTHKIGLLPNFQSGCLLLSCMSCLYILEIKISIQKLITFLYINNETSEWECKKKKTFKIAKKKRKT